MSKITTSYQASVPAWVGYVMFAEAAAFLAVAVLHLSGLLLPLDIWAGVVEALCGIFAVIGAYFVLKQKAQALRLALASHIFSAIGFLTGIIITMRVGLPATDFNGLYHRIMLAVIVIMLVTLILPLIRARRAAHP